MKIVGLIGRSLQHSFSKSYFEEKFQRERIADSYQFKNFELADIAQIKDVIAANPLLIGFNVTIPYKEQIIPFLDALDSEAKAVGAVNTVQVVRSAAGVKLRGFNTDVFGFEQMLLDSLNGSCKKALILGTGGASKAVAFVLEKLGIPFLFVSRAAQSQDLSYTQLTAYHIKKHQLIINTTPIGMFPNINDMPDLPYQFIDHRHLLIDLIYNPTKTMFLEQGENAGATICNGQNMLEIQAEKSWELYHQ